MRSRRARSCYPVLGADDPRWSTAVVLVWALVALLGLLAAVGAGSVAAWCARRLSRRES
jgi:hypothetical protein